MADKDDLACAEDRFLADWWPLEMAVAWVATGDKLQASAACAHALRRREFPQDRHPSFCMYMIGAEGLARRLEAIDGSIYRSEMRKGWSPGKVGKTGKHPLDNAMEATARRMTGKIAKGCSDDAERSDVPTHLWKSAALVDNRRLGLILRSPEQPDGPAWQHIDVPAAPFRTVGAKRGRRSAGLGESAHVDRSGGTTGKRLRAKAARDGVTSSVKKVLRQPGRPKGSRDIH
jgi:hypothetical protein